MAININENPPYALRQVKLTLYKDDVSGELWIDRGVDGWNRIVSAKELETAIANIDIPESTPTTPTPQVGTLIYKGEQVIDFPSVSGQSSNTQNIPVAGALPGDVVNVSRPTGLDAQCFIYAFCNGADNVSVRMHNFKATNALDLPSATYLITVIRY